MSEIRAVVIVEDDYHVRVSAMQLLTRHGYEVRAYADGESFLHGESAGKVDCLLLDVGLPGMDGIAVMRVLWDSGARLPVILMTGGDDMEAHLESSTLGAFSILEKPCPADVLIDTIEQAFVASSRNA
jgi:FixJ family two-component response regulator